jgi:hypothetical protein
LGYKSRIKEAQVELTVVVIGNRTVTLADNVLW